MKKMLIAILVLWILCACSVQPTQPAPVGTLEGNVTIGPLMPAQRINEPTPTVPAAVYMAQSIQIFKEDGMTPVLKISIKGDGTYKQELAAGTYVVALVKMGIGFSKDLPRTITIRSGEVTRLDIDIDTGIR